MSIESRIEAAVSTIESTATNAPAHIAAMQGHENSVENAASAAIGAMIEWKDYQQVSWVSGTTYSSRKVLFNSAGTIYAPINDGYVAGTSIEDDLAAGELFAYQGLTLADIANLDQTLEGTSGFVVSAEHAKAALDEAFGRINVSRNRIVNPSMAINQENEDGPTATTLGVAYFTADQHAILSHVGTGVGLTAEIVQGAKTRSIKHTITTAATDLTNTKEAASYIIKLEGHNVFDLNGSDVTLKIDNVETNWTGELSIAFSNSDLSRSYVTTAPVVSGPNTVAVTVPFETLTVIDNDNTVGLFIFIGSNNEGTRSTSTLDQWQTGDFRTATTATLWAKTINNYVEIANVDLYAGSVPRMFQPNSYAQDLSECKWYWRKSYDQGTLPAAPANIGSRNYIASGTVRTQHTETFENMRAAPGIKLFSITGVEGVIMEVSGGGDVAASAAEISESGFKITKDTNHIDEWMYGFHYTANARL